MTHILVVACFILRSLALLIAVSSMMLNAQEYCESPHALLSVESERAPYTYITVATDLTPNNRAKKILNSDVAYVHVVGALEVEGKVFTKDYKKRETIPLDFTVEARFGHFTVVHRESIKGPMVERRVLGVSITNVECTGVHPVIGRVPTEQ